MRNKAVIVTTSWDDGHKLDMKIVDLLEDYKLKGTFYLPLNYKDMNEKLSKADIKSISDVQEVGAHSISHPILTKISLDKAHEEILHSKEKLEEIIKKRVECFSYPFGCFNQEIKSIVKECKFLCSRTTKELDLSWSTDPFEMNTTIRVANHYIGYFSPLIKLKLLSINNILDWEHLSKSLFNLVYKQGGVFHLWGHSWEIDENNNWAKLENLFKYISKREDVLYLKNSDIFKLNLGN